MPITWSTMIQAGLPAGNMQTFATLLDSFEFEEEIGNSLVVKEPVGVVGAITPWNYPLHQIICKVGGALAAGCTVVLKPSEVAPLNAFILAEIVHEVGLPAGVFNLVTGTGPVVGEAIAAHPGVDMVSFTGSTRAGKRVAEVASGTVKRVALELGGKSANIVLDDADFAAGHPQGRLRRLPQLGPDVHRPHPHARAEQPLRRGARHRRRGRRRDAGRRPGQGGHAPRPADQPGPVGPGAGLHPEGHRRGRASSPPVASASRRARRRATS